MGNNEDVLIIGGGVIGVCSAYFLARQGCQVTVVEQGEIASGCSYGNAGLIVPSHSIPLAAPGVLTRGLKWMLQADSPFYVKPRFNRDLISWLWRFRSYCNPAAVQRGLPLLLDLQRQSLALFDSIIKREQLDCSFKQNGNLALFKTDHGYREGLEEARLLQESGLTLEILDAEAVRSREPAVQPDVVGGVFFKEDAQVDPDLFVRGLADQVRELGGKLVTSTRVKGFELRGRRVSTVMTSRGDYSPDQVVIATGAWSQGLARHLNLKLPVQPAKGYSITVKNPKLCPRTPLMLAEARAAVTPLGSGLRFAGTLELAGFDMTINQRRVNAIRQAATDYLIGTEAADLIEAWRGLRPCTPDGLPLIGRPRSLENLVVATGHAMLGISLGPVTGQLVGQVVGGQLPAVDLNALGVDRFSV
jgi:D-amino-acid dehydrogenase